MARTTHRPPADTLEEIDSLAHRIGDWIALHRVLVIGSIAAVLIAAAAAGAWQAWSGSREAAAAAVVSAARNDLVSAMGGTPGSIEIPEPANPETARSVREEYAARFLELSREHAGSRAGLEAALVAGNLLEALGRPEEAIEAWQQGLASAPRRSALRGVVLDRLARAHENAGRFADAARAHEQAAGIDEYPLASVALGDAARCWLDAGDTDRGLSLYEQIRARKEANELPPTVRTRLEEARAAAAAVPAA